MGISMQLSGKAAVICLVIRLSANNWALGFRAPAIIHGHRSTSDIAPVCGTKFMRVPSLLRILNTPVLDSLNPEERFGWNAREMNDEPSPNQNVETPEPTTSSVVPEIPAGLAYTVQMGESSAANQDWIAADMNAIGDGTEASGQGPPMVGVPEARETSLNDKSFAFSPEEPTDQVEPVVVVPDDPAAHEDQEDTSAMHHQEEPIESDSVLEDDKAQDVVGMNPEETLQPPAFARPEASPPAQDDSDITSEETVQPPAFARPEASPPAQDAAELVEPEETMRPPAFARPEACPPSITMPQFRVSDIKKTLSTPALKTSLTQIAIAFRSDLMVEDIREIRVGTVDESHLDVEALVCKDDDCVMVQVPVDYPTSCRGSDDTSQCILDNIEELSRMLKVEEESELFPTEKTLLERERLLKDVVSPKFLEYPSWWSTPIVLARDCESLRVVLNEADCQPQLQRLFRKNSPKNVRKLVQAAIVAVGPCGVLLRALDTKNNLHEVPIPFAVAATDAERLRAAVLELFD